MSTSVLRRVSLPRRCALLPFLGGGAWRRKVLLVSEVVYGFAVTSPAVSLTLIPPTHPCFQFHGILKFHLRFLEVTLDDVFLARVVSGLSGPSVTPICIAMHPSNVDGLWIVSIVLHHSSFAGLGAMSGFEVATVSGLIFCCFDRDVLASVLDSLVHLMFGIGGVFIFGFQHQLFVCASTLSLLCIELH
ncbi:hypothetical protein Bca4012_056385 [Brassica carinata]|uniref:Uncharacterized protein n=1 Tax=Brassica carinata TaxID=52824 RepID=A0A8X8B471_BRACI|nr:hypothetical protein Bca52824_013790 [Brassica carinata]